jgi:T6SS, Transcription factor, DNA binding domain
MPHPSIADEAPAEHKLTVYDKEHAVTYVRLLDAAKEGADWREASRIVLRIDPDQHVEKARRTYDSHLARARRLSRYGYRLLLRDGWP